MTLEIDLELLKEFEKNLDPRNPEGSSIPARVLGYGEISTVFEIGDERQRGLAYKRMPLFVDEPELLQYGAAFEAYCGLLADSVGLELPQYGCVSVPREQQAPVMYLAQRKLDPASVGNKAIHVIPPEDTIRLVRQVLRELRKVWEFNKLNPSNEIGIDGQVSNWAVEGFDPRLGRLASDIDLIYFDTSTPLFRLNGIEQLNPELFLRSAPSFLVWLIRLLFLEDVVTRYYDFHLVVIDLIGNFYKEQLPALVPDLIDTANDFFENEAMELDVEPVTLKQVRSYYREDAFIWRFYLSARKIDRFLRERVTRSGYPYILPNRIKR